MISPSLQKIRDEKGLLVQDAIFALFLMKLMDEKVKMRCRK